MKSIQLSENDKKVIIEITKKWDKSAFAYAINALSDAWTTTFGMLMDYKKTELKERFFVLIDTNFSRIDSFTCFKDINFDYRQVSEITSDEIKSLIINNGLTITNVIDNVIELNGIIGVGLISLGDGLKDYIWNKCKTNNSL